MPSSPEYALARLDGWYSKRVDATENDQFFDGLVLVVQRSLLKTNMPKDQVKADLKMLGEHLPKYEFFMGVKGFFTSEYSSLESEMERLKDKFPKDTCEHCQDHLHQLQKTHELLRQFVDRVRKTASDKFPEDLTDDQINAVFLQIFGDYRGFTRWYQNYMSFHIHLSEHVTVDENLPRGMSLKLYQAIRSMSHYYFGAVFGDLVAPPK